MTCNDAIMRIIVCDVTTVDYGIIIGTLTPLLLVLVSMLLLLLAFRYNGIVTN